MNRVERTALISVLINIGLVFLKVMLAALSGSLALVADAWHSASDVAASGLVWAGARISRRGRGPHLAIVENVVGLIIAILILWAAVGIFRRVSAAAGAQITYLPIAIGGSLAAALISYFAAQYKLFVGREVNSLSLVADGYHSRMDTLTTVAVVIGLMGHAIGVELDRIAAAVVAVFVVASGLEILLASVGGLREGTVTRSAMITRLMDSEAIGAVRASLDRLGVVGWVRGLVQSLRSAEGRRRAIGGAVLVIIALWAAAGIYFVGPGYAGVVLRCGRRLDDVAGPGAHYRIPWPVDRVIRVATAEVRRVELGFRTRTTPRAITQVAAEFYATLWESRHAAGAYEKHPEEALRLTGDENIVDVNCVVLYRVADPLKYLFSTAEADSLVRFAAGTVLGSATGSRSINDVLTTRREELEVTLTDSLQSLLDASHVGVQVIGVNLQDMHPPLEVVPAFRDVASAMEDKSRIMNEALAYKNEVVPKARGEAERMMREAEGYKSERVNRAEGDADRFIAMAAEYAKARQVSETRLYIETMESLLKGMEKFIISSDINLSRYDIRVFDPSLSSGAVMEQ